MTGATQLPATTRAPAGHRPGTAAEDEADNGRADETPSAVQAHTPGTHPSAQSRPPEDHTSVLHPTGVHATARIRAAHNGRTTTLPLLHNDGPFHLRRLRARAGRARVSVIGAMSAPLGGDRLELDIAAEARSELEVTTAAATIALRGSTTAPATYDVRLTVGENASLNWLPQPLISTRGSTLHQSYTVELASTSRLLLREEQLLGRTAEPPGHLSTRLTVRRDGQLLLDQHTTYGDPAPAWDGPAVLGGHRATGQLLAVYPELTADQKPCVIGDDPVEGCAVLTPLANGPGMLATAVAHTPAHLRRLLDTALAHALIAQA
ncbi:urease accessory protein UreD [Streptomyces sp. NBC_01481]|uniref:urease accessory protein UreD n=1 Tax=Streptomyces sp. NBC_01481 TaxID=2975869 RepID=UPI002253421C|nr:urease accessory protein UreD [Streptomyces sp. NBC_01481]MCX4586328.1 urease accessory protein UreD [Streptomyces sp. NBC_01481]